MKKITGYARAVLLSLVAALAIDMLMNTDSYKSGIETAFKRKKANTEEGTGYTLDESSKEKKYRLVPIPSVSLPQF